MPKGVRSELPTRPVPYPRFDGTQPCRDIDPETYFPTNAKESYYAPKVTAPLCAECPFLQECRDYAISYGVSGYWGGMSEPARRAERARLGIAAIPVRISEHELVRDRLAELENGVRTIEDLVAAVGCSSKTIERHRRARKQRSDGEAA